MTFALTAQGLATQSYRKLGLVAAGGTPTADQMSQAIINLNMMLKGLQTDGINLYRQEQVSLSVDAGQGAIGNPVVITPKVMGFEEGRWVVQGGPNQYERPLGIASYVDYMTLPNKTAQSSSGPSQVMFDRQNLTSNLYLWPVPAVSGTLNCTVGRMVADVNLPTDPLDFPDEWTEGMVYMLADRLAEDEGVADSEGGSETMQRITQRAVTFYQKLLNFDRPTSVFMRPWGRKGSGRAWR